MAEHSRVCPPSHVPRLLGWLTPRDRTTILKVGETHEFRDMRVTAVAARHVVGISGWGRSMTQLTYCLHYKSCGYYFLAVQMCIVAAAGAAPGPSTERYSAAVIRQEPEPGIRFSSGLTVCDETLRKGRWVSRYWLSTGMIKPEVHLEEERSVMETLPIDAFELAIEGEDLAGSWRWIKAQQSKVQNPEDQLVTFELASGTRPITVKVHTLLHGGPVMIRWLEVTNTGRKPTAITKVSPWAGLLWNTPNYGERIQSGND